MELKQITRTERKTIRLNLRTTKSISKWMRENNVSPQKVFDLSMQELIKGK